MNSTIANKQAFSTKAAMQIREQLTHDIYIPSNGWSPPRTLKPSYYTHNNAYSHRHMNMYLGTCILMAISKTLVLIQLFQFSLIPKSKTFWNVFKQAYSHALWNTNIYQNGTYLSCKTLTNNEVANRLTVGWLVHGLAGQQFLHRAADWSHSLDVIRLADILDCAYWHLFVK